MDFRSKEKVNKYQLLNYIKKVFRKDIKINPTETEVVNRINNDPGMVCEIPLFKQIKELKEWMTKHYRIYKQYGL